MIRIHRSRPLAQIGRRRVRLSQSEHQLLVVLGMMDNKVVTTDLLLDTALEHPVRLPVDRQLLFCRIARLKKKIGADRLQHNGRGYVLVGDVQFFE
jgi:DNA-binding response OmpR family regulator